MMKKSLLALAMAGSIAAAPVALAEHMCPSSMCHCQMSHSKTYDKLNLDASQRAKLKSIKDEFRAEMKMSRDKMKQLRMQMRTMVMSDSLDQAMVEKFASEKAELMKSMTKARIMAKNKMYNLLTPAQKMKYKSMMDEFQKKMMMQSNAQ